MPIELKFKTSARLALAISASFPLSGYGASAGKIDFAMGPVTALSSDGRSRPLTKGSDVNAGETINTGDGRAQLRYTDGSQVSLQPGTQYRIDEYRFNGKSDGEEKAFFNLIKGSFRTITGLIGKANKEAYKVTTPVATIGIRGTEFVVKSDDNGVTVSTGEGLVQVCTAGGCIILGSGESAVVIDKDGKPVRIINTGGTATSEKPTTPSVNITTKDPVVPIQLLSGPGYAMAYAYMDGSEGNTGTYQTGTATFNGSSELTKFVNSTCSNSPCTYEMTGMAGGFTDGTIGWGRWSAGTASDSSPSSSSINDFHYVVGVPTSSSQIAALAGTTGTYSFLGATAPTNSNGQAGSAVGISGGLTANFSSSTVNYWISGITIGGYTYNIGSSGSPNTLSRSGAFLSTGGTASVSGGFSGAGALSVNGLFVGANAARAGLTYQFEEFGTFSTIAGAVTYKKN